MTKIPLNNNIVQLEGGDSVVQVTWQKKNGDIVVRYLNVLSTFKIGDYNSWGWKVLNIKYHFKGKYYPYKEYYTLLDKIHKRELKVANMKLKMAYTYKSIYQVGFILFLFKYIVPMIKKVV